MNCVRTVSLEVIKSKAVFQKICKFYAAMLKKDFANQNSEIILA